MKRYFLLIVFLLLLWPMVPAAAQDCPLPDEIVAPNFSYNAPDGTPNFDPIIPQITDYLNAGGVADTLPEYFAGIEADEEILLQSMSSQVWRVNVDEDESNELLITLSIVHTGFWGGGLLLYDCVDSTYELIGQANVEGWTYGGWGFDVFNIADQTQNGQPEIYIQGDNGVRVQGYEVLTWTGSEFLRLEWITNFADDPLSENYGNAMFFIDMDDDGLDEVQIHFDYDPRERDFPYMDIYQIRDEAFHFHCQIYLGDEAFLGDASYQYLIETLEEADSYFRCGYDDVAESLFRQVVEDDALEEVPTGNFGELFERENLRAFSLYRLVLLHARRGDVDAAAQAYAQLNAEFPVEVPGSNYTSMAEAFWLEYEQSGDWNAACEALTAHIEPTVTMILEDDTRWANALYLSSVAGYPGHRPNSMIRGCPADLDLE